MRVALMPGTDRDLLQVLHRVGSMCRATRGRMAPTSAAHRTNLTANRNNTAIRGTVNLHREGRDRGSYKRRPILRPNSLIPAYGTQPYGSNWRVAGGRDNGGSPESSRHWSEFQTDHKVVRCCKGMSRP